MELVNGIRIFNATPHPITFQVNDALVIVEPDEVINASIVESPFVEYSRGPAYHGIEFVTPRFCATEEGIDIINNARRNGADLIVGSIIAAQAYPQQVVAMVPAIGFERVPPAEKRMRADKFTVYH